MIVVALAVVFAVLALFVGVATGVLRRRGYNPGRRAYVRCRQGHLFATIFIPGVSFRAVRLGTARYQRCPVGRHWSLVTLVKVADLTPDERAAADQYLNRWLP